MKELQKIFKYRLENQLFGDGDGNGDGSGNVDPNQSDPQTEPTVSKALYDKAASELAALKKQNRELMNAEQRAKADQEEKDQKLQELMNFKNKSIIKNNLLTTGMEEKYVNEISDVLVTGDMDKIAEVISKSIKETLKAKDKEIQKLQLENTKRPSSAGNNNNDNGEITIDSLKGKTLDEIQKIVNEHPELKTNF